MRKLILIQLILLCGLYMTGQELIGDPIGGGGPKRPISLARSNSTQPIRGLILNDNKIDIPITMNFAIPDIIREQQFGNFSYSLDIKFFQNQDLTAEKFYQPQCVEITTEHSSPHCQDCYPSNYFNYTAFLNHTVDLLEIPELYNLSCEELKHLGVKIEVELFGCTQNNNFYVIDPRDFSSCSSQSLWPSPCYLTERSDYLETQLNCDEYNPNNTRSKSTTISTKTIYNLNGQLISDIKYPGLYIICMSNNKFFECEKIFIFQ